VAGSAVLLDGADVSGAAESPLDSGGTDSGAALAAGAEVSVAAGAAVTDAGEDSDGVADPPSLPLHAAATSDIVTKPAVNQLAVFVQRRARVDEVRMFSPFSKISTMSSSLIRIDERREARPVFPTQDAQPDRNTGRQAISTASKLRMTPEADGGNDLR
jgi:hypothetical protein